MSNSKYTPISELHPTMVVHSFGWGLRSECQLLPSIQCKYGRRGGRGGEGGREDGNWFVSG